MNMTKLACAALLTLTICLAPPGRAATVNDDPLQIGLSARSLALGNAFLSVNNNADAALGNAAGLSQLRTPQFNSTAGQHLGDFNFLVLNGGRPFNFGSFGLGYVSNSTVFTASGASAESRYAFSCLVAALSSPENFLFRNLSLGANLKFYTKNLTSASQTSSTAHGQEMNLGLRYRASPALNLGMYLENVLPASAGGKLVWNDNTEESFPTLVHLGSSFKLPAQPVTVGFDYLLFPTQNKVPNLLKIGLEWLPAQFLALRLGLDQSHQQEQTQVSHNLAYGIGFNTAGFGFDYSYHAYGNLSSNFVSVAYQPAWLASKPAPPVTATSESTAVPKIPLVVFTDLAPDYWAKPAIEALATLKIISGFPDQTFRPEAPLSRKDLRAALLKLAQLADAANVATIKFTGNPAKPLTRAEAVSALARFDNLLPAQVYEAPYADVPGRFWAAESITAAKQAGLLDFIKTDQFYPAQVISRGEAAELIAKTKLGKQRIAQLY